MNEELTKILATADLRQTKPRATIFDALKTSHAPMSIVDIINKCPSVDKVSVYRTIALFMKLDIITSVPHGWKHLYELSSPFKPHHHHLTCTQCGALIEIHSQKLESIIADLTHDHQFSPTGHHVEVTGICAVCKETASNNTAHL